jgi:hypothetical protein
MNSMRLAVLSNEKLDKWINWSLLGPPLLHPLSEIEDASLVAPKPLAWLYRNEWIRTFQAAGKADTLFWMQGSARPELPIAIAALAAPSARRSAFVVDAWKGSVTKIGLLAVAQRLNPCFVAFREGRDELSRRFPSVRFEWMPFGCDPDVFKPTTAARDVFAYWMGRRHEPLHQAMLRYCEKRNLTYRYTRQGGEFKNPADLGALVGRCEYFLVTPPDLDNPTKTGGFSPFVMRYLEGLSAGARLLGVLPRSGEYDALLPRDAILEVAADGSDLAEKLDADRFNDGARAAVQSASALVRKHHSWKRRAEQIYDVLKTGRSADFSSVSP